MEVHGNLVAVNVDYRIPCIPDSTVQKEDTNRKETVTRLFQQFENHPNRDTLLQDLNQSEEINPFSEKSKDLITDLGNTEISELFETSSKIQCLIALYLGKRTLSTAPAAKCLQPTERNRQLNSTSCQFPATLSTWILPTVPNMDHLCGSARTAKYLICWRKPAATKMVTAKLFWKDGTRMTGTASLCQMLGGLKNISDNMTCTGYQPNNVWSG